MKVHLSGMRCLILSISLANNTICLTPLRKAVIRRKNCKKLVEQLYRLLITSLLNLFLNLQPIVMYVGDSLTEVIRRYKNTLIFQLTLMKKMVVVNLTFHKECLDLLILHRVLIVNQSLFLNHLMQLLQVVILPTDINLYLKQYFYIDLIRMFL